MGKSKTRKKVNRKRSTSRRDTSLSLSAPVSRFSGGVILHTPASALASHKEAVGVGNRWRGPLRTAKVLTSNTVILPDSVKKSAAR